MEEKIEELSILFGRPQKYHVALNKKTLKSSHFQNAILSCGEISREMQQCALIALNEHSK